MRGNANELLAKLELGTTDYNTQQLWVVFRKSKQQKNL